MVFHLDVHVEYGAKILFAIRTREAERVVAVVDVDSHDTLDEILLTLPIRAETGQVVDVTVTALRCYADFAGSVSRLLKQ